MLLTKMTREPEPERNFEKRYRVKRPTLALEERDHHQAATTLRVGVMLTVVGPSEDPRFLLVEVGGVQLQIFETDLKDRCTAHVLRPKRRRASEHDPSIRVVSSSTAAG